MLWKWFFGVEIHPQDLVSKGKEEVMFDKVVEEEGYNILSILMLILMSFYSWHKLGIYTWVIIWTLVSSFTYASWI